MTFANARNSVAERQNRSGAAWRAKGLLLSADVLRGSALFIGFPLIPLC